MVFLPLLWEQSKKEVSLLATDSAPAIPEDILIKKIIFLAAVCKYTLTDAGVLGGLRIRHPTPPSGSQM